MGRSVVVSGQGALDRCSYLPVVPDAGVEGQQPLEDPGPQAGGDASAVAFEAELVLQGPDDRLDPLPQPVREVAGSLLVLIGTSGSPVLCEMRGAGDLLRQQPAGEHLFRPGREVLTQDRAPAGSPGGWTADGVACPALAVSTDLLGRWRFSLMLPDVTRRGGRMRVAVHRR